MCWLIINRSKEYVTVSSIIIIKKYPKPLSNQSEPNREYKDIVSVFLNRHNNFEKTNLYMYLLFLIDPGESQI